MHLSESVPQDLMCLRSRCVAVRWIQPSDLYVTIEDCSSPSAEPPVPATVHLAPESCIYIPHARSAVELQPAAVLCARALETWFGDLSATTRRLAPRREVRARPAPREGTRPFLARSGKSLSSPAAHASLPLPLPPYPVLACDTLRPHAPRLSPTLAGGPIRRATPCMITAGGSGARATAFSSPLANGPKSGL